MSKFSFLVANTQEGLSLLETIEGEYSLFYSRIENGCTSFGMSYRSTWHHLIEKKGIYILNGKYDCDHGQGLRASAGKVPDANILGERFFNVRDLTYQELSFSQIKKVLKGESINV